MGSFVLLLGGPLTMTDRLRAQTDGGRLIAADSGMRHAALFDDAVELWLGDFDSSDAALKARYASVPRERHDADKAKSDGELAAEAALARGATSLVLAGALGGERSDHVFLNAALAQRLAKEGTPVVATSGVEELRPLGRGLNRFDFPLDTRFSVIGFTDIGDLIITGAQWPLDRVHVPFGSSWTLSNVVTGPLSITMGTGEGFVLAHPAAAQ